jgi:alkylation response protein AidB-like acyl-CoA dehydrogenase
LTRRGGLRETEPLVKDPLDRQRRLREIYDIFEGTEQIQQLVIARAISGLRIE